MDFQELVRKRHSVRGYRPDPVEEEKLQQVLEAARLAPTAASRQPLHLIVIRTAGRAEELQRIYQRPWFVQAPLLICACAVPAQGWTRHDGKNYSDVDVSIVMDHLILAATELGLGTCWVAAFNVPAAREVLGLPEAVEPVVFTPLGYPAEHVVPAKKRKELSEMVKYDRW